MRLRTEKREICHLFREVNRNRLARRLLPKGTLTGHNAENVSKTTSEAAKIVTCRLREVKGELRTRREARGTAFRESGHTKPKGRKWLDRFISQDRHGSRGTQKLENAPTGKSGLLKNPKMV